MTLTPEQKAEGWRWHFGGPSPLKDPGTTIEWMVPGEIGPAKTKNGTFGWQGYYKQFAYRIIEAHGADAEPVRPTPFPASMDALVYGDDGWSQPFFTDGVWPEWLPDDAEWQFAPGGFAWHGRKAFDGEFAIRVRRREPKRETGECVLIVTARTPSLEFQGTIDLIDGKPDLSTLKIAEGSA